MMELYYGNGTVPQHGELKWGIESFDDEPNLNGKRWRCDVEDEDDHSRSVDYLLEDFDDIFLNSLVLDDSEAYNWKKRQAGIGRSEPEEDEPVVEVGEINEEGCVLQLQDLEKVMGQQLSSKTRICFRDALYRLANNTHHLQLESEANMNIDRAVANLMFNEIVHVIHNLHSTIT